MKILTLVVTYNGAQFIRHCLDSLCQSNVSMDVFVVDNASSDSTSEIVGNEYPFCKLIQNKRNVGFGAANNIGLAYAVENSYDSVFLINQDAVVFPDTLACLLEEQKKFPQYGILSPLHLSGKVTTLDYRFYQYIVNGCPDYIHDLLLKRPVRSVYSSRFINAALWLLSITCIRRVGGFDPLFFHTGEDIDYYNRAIYKGFSVGICPYAKAIHFRNNQVKEARSEKYFMHKYAHTVVYLKQPARVFSCGQVLYACWLEALTAFLSGKGRAGLYNLQLFFKLSSIRKQLKLHWETCRGNRENVYLDL